MCTWTRGNKRLRQKDRRVLMGSKDPNSTQIDCQRATAATDRLLAPDRRSRSYRARAESASARLSFDTVPGRVRRCRRFPLSEMPNENLAAMRAAAQAKRKKKTKKKV